MENGLTAANAPDWLSGLILDGIVAGVGAVLGFVPQMLVLFLLLAFLESCGYMGPYCVCARPRVPQVWALRQIFHPHPDRYGLRRARYYGVQNH